MASILREISLLSTHLIMYSTMKTKRYLLLCAFLSFAFASIAQSKLITVFSDSAYQLTGVAVSKSGRVFTNYPYWSDQYKYALVEVLPNNSVKPYPNEEMNSWKPGDDGMSKWVCVQSVVIDDSDRMWVVDPASPKQKGVYNESQKLVEIDLSANRVVKTFPLKSATGNQSYINDVRVDTKKQIAYLTNSAEGGIVIVDLTSGVVRQVLQGDESVLSDPTYNFQIDGQTVEKNGAVFKVNSDGIALSPTGDSLFYKPLTDDNLYRISTKILLDTSLSLSQIAAEVRFVGKFTTTDGMIFDKKGNLYLGDIEHSRIIRMSPNGQMTELVKDPKLVWPDSYHASDDGFLYISCSQINKQPDFNNGVNKRETPYSIFKIKIE